MRKELPQDLADVLEEAANGSDAGRERAQGMVARSIWTPPPEEELRAWKKAWKDHPRPYLTK